MGPRTGLDMCGKFRPHRDSIPGPFSKVIPTNSERYGNVYVHDMYKMQGLLVLYLVRNIRRGVL